MVEPNGKPAFPLSAMVSGLLSGHGGLSLVAGGAISLRFQQGPAWIALDGSSIFSYVLDDQTHLGQSRLGLIGGWLGTGQLRPHIGVGISAQFWTFQEENFPKQQGLGWGLDLEAGGAYPLLPHFSLELSARGTADLLRVTIENTEAKPGIFSGELRIGLRLGD